MPVREEGWLSCSSPAGSSRRWRQAAVAVGRLDAALAGNPLRRAWTFWSELDAARRHAEADGRKVDLFRLAAHLHGLPLRLGDTASAPERGREIAGLNYAIELRSWMAAPDPEQVRLRDIALDSLRAQDAASRCSPPRPAACSTGWRGGAAGPPSAPPCRCTCATAGSRSTRWPPSPAAMPCGPGRTDPDGFTVRFLETVRREAAEGRDRLLTMEREWREARLRVDHRAGARSNSRLPAAVDLLAASPLLSISALAEALGCSVEGASRMLDALVQLEVAAEVTGRTGRGARRLYGLKRLLPIRAETTAVRRRTQGRAAGTAETGPDRALRRTGGRFRGGRGDAGRRAGRTGAPRGGELRLRRARPADRRGRRADPRRPPVARSDRPRRQAFHVGRQR